MFELQTAFNGSDRDLFRFAKPPQNGDNPGNSSDVET